MKYKGGAWYIDEKLDLSSLDNIKKNIIKELNRKKYYHDSSKYSNGGYIKVRLYDGLTQFFWQEDEYEDNTPSWLMLEENFLLTDCDNITWHSFLSECEDVFCSYFGNRVLWRVEFTKLMPKNTMHKHVDIGCKAKHRINIVFEDDINSGLWMEEFFYKFEKYKLYEVNTSYVHAAANYSNKIRYALIFDVVDSLEDLIEFRRESLLRKHGEKNKMTEQG